MTIPSFRRCTRFMSVLLLSACVVALQGCGIIYKTTGDVLVSFGKSNMMPYVLTTSDVPMSCALGLSTTPLLMSFGAVGAHPAELGTMVYATAATCSDHKALEAQLLYLRELNKGNVAAAQDARIVQKRWAAISAKRQLISYNYAIRIYGEVENGQCPELEDDYDQLVWMFGMLSGLQALLNDTTAGGTVGVPRNIAAKAADGAACLDNDKWWGVPKAIQASVWTMLPMLGPKGVDSWQLLQDAADKGFKSGVRLGSAMYAMAAYSKGDKQRLRDAIRDFAAHDTNINANYRLLDAIAKTMVTGLSDRVWTKATGKRTPYGELGSFWDDAPAQPAIDISGLLN